MDEARRARLRLRWFLVDPEYSLRDVGKKDHVRWHASPRAALTDARKVRRPLVRVDGAAADLLDDRQEFRARHVRQFWWFKGERGAPSRLVVYQSHDTSRESDPAEPARCFAGGHVPRVLATIPIADPVDLDRVSVALDAAWREYMTERPSNARNLTFAKENIERFESVDRHIRELARANRLLAPGGRTLFAAPRDGPPPVERRADSGDFRSRDPFGEPSILRDDCSR